VSIAATVRSRASSAAAPMPINSEPAMQRCPAQPKADPMMASTVGSHSASGITSRTFFAPPADYTRLRCSVAS
jgi:hypothetical protein